MIHGLFCNLFTNLATEAPQAVQHWFISANDTAINLLHITSEAMDALQENIVLPTTCHRYSHYRYSNNR